MSNKKDKLNFNKFIATGLLGLMVVMYIFSLWLQKQFDLCCVGYLKAFSEAAMVGALADWFAVTALFNKPLGLPIPHTNIIENRKSDIGDNLGAFVVGNFLTSENIRPYIQRLNVSLYLSQWLSEDKNTNFLIDEICFKIREVIQVVDDEKVVNFISEKSKLLIKDLKVHLLVSELLMHLYNHKEHQRLLDYILERIQVYILANKEMIRKRVERESSSFIPSFIDDILAKKITDGLYSYVKEISENINHPLRVEIDDKIYKLSEDVASGNKLNREIKILKDRILNEEKVYVYAQNLWEYTKNVILSDLNYSMESSLVKSYFKKSIGDIIQKLEKDKLTQRKIDYWVQKNAYRYVLRNRGEVGNLIRSTVGNWKGRELSEKLELEVGKDLQFIRVNGTLVGGIIGILIYIVTQLFV